MSNMGEVKGGHHTDLHYTTILRNLVNDPNVFDGIQESNNLKTN